MTNCQVIYHKLLVRGFPPFLLLLMLSSFAFGFFPFDICKFMVWKGQKMQSASLLHSAAS